MPFKSPKQQAAIVNGTYTALHFTISQYGQYSMVSDILIQQGFDSPEAAKEAIDPEMLEAENKWREHFDMAPKVDWAEESKKYYAGDYLSSGMRLTAKDLRKAAQKLRDNNVPVSSI